MMTEQTLAMESEQLEILGFLEKHPPFLGLPADVLHKLAKSVDVLYHKADTPITKFGEPALHWYVVRSGAVEIFRRDGTLYNRLNEGGHFGEAGLLQKRQQIRFPATALEDTLLYLIPPAIFLEVFETQEAFADLVEVENRTRLRTVISKSEQSNELMNASVESLLTREPVTATAETSIAQAAAIMTDASVSSLLVVENDSLGIITDRDIRTRAVAKGLPLGDPISKITTNDIVYVRHDQLAFEAMLLMLRNNIHHLPVLRNEKPIGVLALSDILRYESRNSLFVVSRIFHQQSVEELASLKDEVRASFVRMIREDANSHMVGSAMGAIGRSYKQRLLELAEAQFGPPPIPYCFLALGSMARQEQLIVTDQDNAMILDNRFDPEKHDAYFSDVAKFVSDGLAACGYSLCTGDVMATNPRWRQPLRVWQQYFTDWIESPTPESLLTSNIFFDLDGVYGRTAFAETLRVLIAQKAKGNSRFLASMARNALRRTPPIGFFKDFVVEPDGRHTRAINLKRRGTAPLTDLIRIHALAIGSRSRNSFDRLQDIIKANILPPGRGPDLRDALEFISLVRARNQAQDIVAGQEPDNSMAPENLSEFERKNLRDAFLILANAQKYLKFRYQPGRLA
jgi:CBS domain-containing protein